MDKASLTKRVISGAVLFVILLAAGLLGGPVLLGLTLFVSIIGLNEMYRVLGIYKTGVPRKENLLFYVAAVMCTLYYATLSMVVNHAGSLFIASVVCMFAFIIIMLVILMGIYVFTFPKYTVEDVAFAFFGAFYVPVFMSCTYLTRNLDDGLFMFWLIFISSWVCDTCAYFVGCTIGKHKLAPVLSPKKSIEGSVGGIVGSIIVAGLFGYFIQYKLFGSTNNALNYMVICGLGSIVSQIGDLAASAIKRNRNIKDYGNLIPGHGGIMDRFDSVIFVAPAIYLLAAVLL